MPNTILENLSGKKLAIIGTVLICSQIVCFLIGGLIAPAPSNVQTVISTKCIRPRSDVEKKISKFYIPRAKPGNACTSIKELDSPYVKNNSITADQIVFAFQIPLPKHDIALDFPRWQQNLISVLQFDVVYSNDNIMEKNLKVKFEVQLGYRNKWDPDDHWTLIANSTEERNMECDIDEDSKVNGVMYNCFVLPLFELGSLHHNFYLINLILPSGQPNDKLWGLKDIWLVAMSQNGGFTKVLLSMKTIFFFAVTASLLWFSARVRLLARPSLLIEKMLLVLGASVLFLDFPVEFFSLIVNMPYMLFCDIRQNLFYACILSFWLVFIGEHLTDEAHRNRIRIYWRHLSTVIFGCLCLFIFDVVKRGLPLTNPFDSIWATETGKNFALAFIILVGLFACLYIIFLCYMIYKVFHNISLKRSVLPSMSDARKLHHEGIIYRFKFMMITSLLCATLTITSYIMGQVSEGHWKRDDNIKIRHVSAFFTGICGMWNLYVMALVTFYAPSHKTNSFEEGQKLGIMVDVSE